MNKLFLFLLENHENNQKNNLVYFEKYNVGTLGIIDGLYLGRSGRKRLFK